MDRVARQRGTRSERPRRRPSLLTAVLAVVSVVATFALGSVQAQAVTIDGMNVTWQGTVNGDFITTGNGVLTCSGQTNCANLLSGSNTTLYNDNFNMTAVDVDGNATTYNSSQASLAIPNGAKVVEAMLYWAANSGQWTSDGISWATTGNAFSCNNGTTAATRAAGQPTSMLNQPVKLGISGVNGGAYVDVNYDQIAAEAPTDLKNSLPMMQYYSAQADVTAAFASLNGGTQTITVGNVWAPQGQNCAGGWTLSVVYDLGTAISGQANSFARQVVLYDGHIRMFNGDPAVSATLSGFNAVAAGARMSYGLLEGDTAITGDKATYTVTTNGTTGTATNIPGANSSTANNANIGVSFADSAIAYPGETAGQSSTTLSGALPGNTGANQAVPGLYNGSVDAHAVSLTNVVAKSTAITLTFNSTGDSYLWQSAAISVPIAQLQVVKTAADGVTDTQTINQGDSPSFKIVITNTGSSTINGVTLSDAQAAACNISTGQVLAIGQSIVKTCSGPAATDSYVNSATATGTDAAGGNLVTSTDATTVNVLKPNLDAVKSGGTITGPDASGNYTVTYNVSVSNTGQGDTYVGPLVDTPSFSSNLTISGISWTGTAGGATSGAVTGAGPATLMPAGTKLQGTVAGGGTGQTMSWTVTSTFRFNNQNAATTCAGTGTGLYNAVRLDGATESTTANNSACVNPPVRLPLIDAQKTPGTVTGPDALGNYVVTYAVKVTNSGQVDGTYGALTDTPGFSPNLQVDSASWTASGPGAPSGNSSATAGPYTLAGAGTVLTAGSTHTFTVSVKFHFKDSNPALACNLGASGTGLYNKVSVPGDTTASNDVACVPPPQPPVPTLTLDKVASTIRDVNNNGISDAGDQITYSFTVQNTSAVNLTNIVLNDAKLGLTNFVCFAGTVAPGASVTCPNFVYTLTQADVTAGSVQNTATATGTPPTGTILATGQDSTTTSVQAGPSISLNKTVGTISDLDGNGPDIGDTVVYSFKVTNTGNLNITNLLISDTKLGLTNIGCGNVAVGATVTCTSQTHTLTQAEVDAGAIDNTATVRGTASDGSTVNASGTAHLAITAYPSILLDKQAGAVTDVNGNGRVDVGDTITFNYVVKNTGTVTLNPVTLNDANLGVSNTVCGGSLAPGATVNCPSATHSITQTDLDSGSYNNTATVLGRSPSGSTVQSTDNTSTTVTGTAHLTLKKSAGSVVDANNNGKIDAGDSIAYSFLVTNDGSVSLSNVTVTDSKLGLTNAPICGTSALGAGTSRTCSTATYTLTQADIDSGSVDNTASAFGTPPTGNAVSGSSSTSVTVGALPAISLVKTASAVIDSDNSGTTNPGDTINYTFSVTNTGAVTLSQVQIVDTKISTAAISCGTGDLAPGATRDCAVTVPYHLTQADIDAGKVDNTARARALTPTSALVEGTNSKSVPLTQSPQILLDKQVVPSGDAGTTPFTDVNHNGRVDTGDTLTFRFVVKNTGNVTLNPVQLVDAKLGQNFSTCLSTALAPGATSTCPDYTYTMTQADINAGSIGNTATIHGKSPANVDVSSTDQTSTPVPINVSLTLAKSIGSVTDVNGNGVTDVGDRVTYNFRVVNTGTVSLGSITITDAKLGLNAATCNALDTTPLDPGLSRDCTPVTYTLTLGDINRGSVHNDATAVGTGTDPAATKSQPAPALADLTIVARPSLTLDKQVDVAGVVDANGDGRVDAGDTITYHFFVKNTGNVSLNPVTLTDGKLGLAGGVCNAAITTPLDPGQTRECTVATYTIQVADMDSGSVQNTAIATGVSPDQRQWTAQDSTSTPLLSAPAIALDKIRGPLSDPDNNGPDAGDSFTYTFVVTNNGNVTLNPVTISDTKLGLNSVDCGVGALAPGATKTCTISKTYTITQADANAGVVVNTATAVGTPPTGGQVSGQDSDTADFATLPGVPPPPPPSVSLDKQAAAPVDANANGKIDAGDKITFTYVITNTGTVTLYNPTVTDSKLNLTSQPCNPSTSLDPGAQRVCYEAVHTLTQADIDAGTYDNTATAAAVGPAPKSLPATSAPDTTSTTIAQVKAFTFAKTSMGASDTNGDGRIDAGDTVTYRFLVSNTGTTTLTNLTLNDSKLGITNATCGAGSLAPGASTYCYVSGYAYTIQQPDLNAGSITNTASMSATPPSGAPIIQTSSATTPLTQIASYTFDKTASAIIDNGDGVNSVGDRIVYTFTFTNTGTVSLDPLNVTDNLIGWAGVRCGTTVLDPGTSVSCSAPAYVITQGDIDTGAVNNTATSTATKPDGTTVPGTDSNSVSLTTSPKLSLAKTAGSVVDANNDGRQDAGDTVTYHFVVTNTGNVTLNTVTLTDTKLGLANVACGTGALAPLASRTCSDVTYTLQASDFNAGAAVNNATASALTSTGQQVTGPGTATVPLTEVPGITLDKSASAIVDANGTGKNDAGDTITFSFVVQNTGNVELRNLTLTDPTLGVTTTCGTAPLAAGASRTCTAVTHVLTQTEINSGSYSNTATVAGTTPKGVPASISDSTSTPITQTPGLTLTKSASSIVDTTGDGKNGPGDTITYTFSVYNSGTVSLSSVTITDTKIGLTNPPCGTTALNPGETRNCAISQPYVITVADANAGGVTNTAVASGTKPDGSKQTAPASTTTAVAPLPGYTFDKVAGPVVDTVVDGRTPGVGDTITYTFTVVNTGNVSLSDLTLNDTTLGLVNVSCGSAPLDPGVTRSCTAATYVLSQADLNYGTVANTATLAATSPAGTVLTRVDSTSTNTAGTPSLLLTKTSGGIVNANGNALVDAGDTITYTFTVKNTGTQTLDPVTISDAKLNVTNLACFSGALAPGETRTCTVGVNATYAVTVADADAGKVVNSATATGRTPSGGSVTSTSETTDLISSTPAMTVDKVAGPVVDLDGNGPDVGDTITYTFTIYNTGNVSLSSPTVSDGLLGLVNAPCGTTALAPGTSRACASATYTLTQADVDKGTVDNSATSSGTPPTGPAVTSAPDTTSTTTRGTSSVALDKVAGAVNAGADGIVNAGDTITYTFKVTNTGTYTMSTVTYTDTKLGFHDVSCGTGSLAPGASMDCPPVTYTLTQADIDSGVIANNASASAVDPRSITRTGTDTTSTTLPRTSSLTLDKVAGSVNLGADNKLDVGDTVIYTFTVVNTGTTTLTNVSYTDARLGITGITCGAGTVLPGQSLTCASKTYVLTQADIDSGSVDNNASATATTPTGSTVSGPDTASVPLAPTPGLSLTKVAGAVVDANNDGRQDAGDTIQYTFSVTNTGNVTLNSVSITDTKVGLANVSCGTTPLAPGATRQCTVTSYTLTNADFTTGQVVNNATAAANTPSGAQITSPATTTTALTEVPSVTLDKVAGSIVDANGSGNQNAGDTITFTFSIHNTGNVELRTLTLTDPTLGLSVTCGTAPLAAGATRTCAPVTYVLKQTDVDKGSFDNTATITGTTPRGVQTSGPDSTATPITPSPGLTLTKTGSNIIEASGDNLPGPGDLINYTFTVVNTGTVSFDPVTITDTKLNLDKVACGSGKLLPGATRSCNIIASYTITAADANSGAVVNTAVATGTKPDLTTQVAPGTSTIPITATPNYTFDKTAGAVVDAVADGKFPGVGDTITYSFSVTNTGNVSLSNLAVTDVKLGLTASSCGSTPLDPGQTRACPSFTYTLTQSDLDKGTVDNTASLAATTPAGTVLTKTDSTTTPTAGTPAITVQKTSGGVVDANGSGVMDAGDTVTYTFLVTNTGTQTLDPITITDAKLGLSNVTCFSGPLAPGTAKTCTLGAQAAYTLQQTDVDAGIVTNTVTVAGRTPNGGTVTAPGSVSDTIIAKPSIAVDKTAGQLMDLDGNGPDVGDTITFRFTITNTGNVSLSSPLLNDAKAGLVNVPCGTTPLAPGASRICSAVNYTLTQADVNTGTVDNSATVTAKPPTGPDVTSAPDTTSTDTLGKSALTLDKVAGQVDPGADGIVNAGDTITYTFSVKNTGTYTLHDVTYLDTKLGISGPCGAGTLDPGQTMVCPPMTYVLKQTDIDAGTVDNHASASAIDPRGLTASGTDTTSTPIAQTAALVLDKASTGVVTDHNDGKVPTAGDTVDYTFTVTNTGTTTLTGVTYTDAKLGINGITCGPGTVAPGMSITCATKSYALTQADIDAGKVANTATATGTDPKGVKATGTDSMDVPLTQTPTISLVKSASSVIDNGDGVTPNAGDQISYTFTVTNSGNVTLSLVKLTDTKLGLNGVSCDVITLAPAQTTVCRQVSYTLTQGDIDTGSVANNASVTATPPIGPNVSSSSSTNSSTPGTSSFAFDKAVGSITDVDRNGKVNAGDTVVYSFTVSNTGTTTLNSVTYSDPTLGFTNAPCGSGLLEPGQSRQCPSVTYTLTQANIDAGSIANTATAKLKTPLGAPLSQDDSATLAVAGDSLIGMTKTGSAYIDANGNGRPDAGEKIDYTFTATNLGTETIKSATITDTKLGVTLVCPTPISPGQTVTCQGATYSLLQTDIDAGRVYNSATISALSVLNKPSASAAQTTVSLPEAPELTAAKSAGPVVDANGDGVTPTEGDTVAYTFTVTNTGNVTLNPVTVTDTKLGINQAQCGSGPLAPGVSRSCTLATYLLTQADIDAGQVYNKALVSGTSPSGAQAVARPDSTKPLAQSPTFTWAKTASPLTDNDGNGPDIGDTITYTFTVVNTGNVSYYPVKYTDGKLGILDQFCGTTPLLPGETRQCPAKVYTLTQADIDNPPGQVANTATLYATPPSGVVAQKDSSTLTPTQGFSAVELTKTAGQIVDLDGNGTDVGDSVTYTFQVFNAGTETLTNVRYSDPTLGIDAVCVSGTLAPGASATCNPVTYLLTQADIDRGLVENVATATAAGPRAGENVTGTSTADVYPQQRPGFTLVKNASAVIDNGNGVNDVLDSIRYSFTVKNTGNVDLNPVLVTDAKLGIQSQPCGTSALAPGEERTCLVTAYAITQPDLDAGAVRNVATVSATPPVGAPLVNQASTTTTLTPAQAISLTKAAGSPVDLDGNGFINAGDTVAYSFSVTNTGNVTLTNVTISDAKLGLVAAACGLSTDPLAPGATRTNCVSRTYTLSQADIDAGQVLNRATASGTPPNGSDATGPAEKTTLLPEHPAIQMTKHAGSIIDANASGRFDAGDTILFTFVVKNTGSTTLTTVRYADPKLGIDAPCGAGPLAPGEERTCPSFTYTLTQTDVNAGTFDNAATASGVSPSGTTAPSAPSTTSTVIDPVKGIAVTKTAGSIIDKNGSGRADAGDTIDYTIVVRNTGTVTLDPVTYSDSKLGLTDAPCGSGPLEPGQSRTCPVVTYATLLSDFNLAKIVNVASATGTAPDKTTTSASTTVTTPLPYIPTGSFDKVAATPVDKNGNGVIDAGDTIAYTFSVTNTGNVSSTALVLDDPKLGIVGLSCGTGVLDPGQTVSCTPVTYTLTQADVNAGTVDNTAVVTVTSSRGLKGTVQDSTSTPILAIPNMAVTKTAGAIEDTNGDGLNDAGDTITYTFSVQNTGNVDLSLVSLADSKLGISGQTCGNGTLAPGATASCGTATYTLTQADMDADLVKNTASVTGTPPSGQSITRSAVATVVPVVTEAVRFVKNASAVNDLDGNGPDLNDTIVFSFTVENTGTVTLDPVLITDPKLGVANQPCGTDPLLPGQTRNCLTRTYLLTQADVDSGRVVNTATLSAKTPDGTVLTPQTTVTTPAVGKPAISLDKTASQIADTNGDGRVDVGDTVTYTFQVTNTGTETLNLLTLADPTLNVAGACGTGTLLPGQVRACTTVAYSLTQDDVDRGVLENTATIVAKDPRGGTVSSPDSTSTTIPEAPGLLLAKTASTINDTNGDGKQDVGDTITYTFTVKNTGTVTLDPVSYIDPTFSNTPVACPGGPLLPGQTRVCDTKVYALNLADLNANGKQNNATARGTSPAGTIVTSASGTYTPIQAVRSIAMDKIGEGWVDANGDGLMNAGDTIHYRFIVTNTGNLTLHDVRYSDSRLGIIDAICTTELLDPGHSVECPAYTYTLVQADLDTLVTRSDGSQGPDVLNTALATGLTPKNNRVNGTDSVETPLTEKAQLSLDKVAGTLVDQDGSGGPSPGDTIRYTFTVTNTGNVTVDSVTLTDGKLSLGGAACGAGTLAPKGIRVCPPVDYVLTQADINTGSVDNTATASAVSTLGTKVSSPDSTSTPLAQKPGLSLTKSILRVVDNGDGIVSPGDTVVYGFVVVNTGNVTFATVTYTDPRVGLGPTDCPTGPLLPGETRTCPSVSYTRTQADIDSGAIVNNASATGTGYDGSQTTATSSTTLFSRGSVDVVKIAGPVNDLDGNGPDVGDTITYSFTVTNTGTIPLKSNFISDAKLGISNVPCAPAVLAPGDRAVCPDFTYTLTQADVDAGKVDNTATAYGISAASNLRTPLATDAVHTPFTGSATITLDKVAGAVSDTNANGRVDAGDSIRYTFLVTNTGTETLSNVTLVDVALGINGPCVATNQTSLPPGGTRQCTPVVHVLTLADVNAGTFDNTASVTATDPFGSPRQGVDGTSTSLAPVPVLAFVKSASAIVDVNGDGKQDVGDTITYTFTVTNNGNVTLSPVTFTDPLFSPDPQSCGGPLAPGETRVCATKVYALTLADLNANGRSNSAVAAGVAPDGATVTQRSSTNTPITAIRSIAMDKIAGPILDLDGNGPDAGDIIDYRFVVTNTGNLTLHGVTYTDSRIGLPETSCTSADLDPGATVECPQVAYTLTQSDIDQIVTKANGTLGPAVLNTAVARGFTPKNALVQGADSTETDIVYRSRISIDKVSGGVIDADGNGPDVGDTVIYTFTVTNTGTSTLSPVLITDPKTGLVNAGCGVNLQPGEVRNCPAVTYTLTQADIDAGTVDNTVTVAGTDSVGFVARGTDTTSDVDSGRPAIRLDKASNGASDTNASGRIDVGDSISYTFTVTNTGTETIHAIAVTDPLVANIVCQTTMLAPKASTTCTGSRYVLTLSDLDAGKVDNTASTTALNPHGVLVGATASATTPVAQIPQIALSKDEPGFPKANGLVPDPAAIIDSNNDGRIDAGDTVRYTFTVTNTGTVSLNPVVVDDPAFGAAPLTCDQSVLRPGESRTCGPLSRPITQAEVDAQYVVNTATVSGQTPNGDPNGAVATDRVDNSFPTTSSLSIAKSHDLKPDGFTSNVVDTDNSGTVTPGDTLQYHFVITNTGPTTLTTIQFSDTLLGLQDANCGDPALPLLPGESRSCSTAPYVLSASDIQTGYVDNVATATASAPPGVANPTPADTTDHATILAEPKIAIEKTANFNDLNANGRADVGESITYAFKVTNTGNVRLGRIQMSDPLLGLDHVDCVGQTSATLAPRMSIFCTEQTYTITEADILAGRVDNTATAYGAAGGATATSDPSTATTPFVPMPSITLKKAYVGWDDLDTDGNIDVGEALQFRFTVTNTGNVSLNQILLSDPALNIDQALCTVNGTDASLAPGASRVCIVDVPTTHAVSQDDVLAGKFDNSAVVSASSPPGVDPPAPSESAVSVPLPALTSISLDKAQVGSVLDVNRNGVTDAGDQITYSFTVTSNSNVPLHDVLIDDPLLGLTGADAIPCPDPVDPTLDLPAHGTRVCPEQTYTITQTDINTGSVQNTATVLATPPASTNLPPIESTDIVDTQLDSFPAFELNKSVQVVDVNANGKTDAGDQAQYTFTVTNTGTAVLSDVTVKDPMLGLDGYTCPAFTNIQPKAVVSCSPPAYVINSRDTRIGSLDNYARAVAAPLGNTVRIANFDNTATPVTLSVSPELPGLAGGVIVVVNRRNGTVTVNGVVYKVGPGYRGGLPATGTPLEQQLPLAAGLLLLGALLIVLSRRPRLLAALVRRRRR